MKELMIEEKARAYDEAIERAKNFIENGDKGERTIAESIFAGIMEESEDERIREALIHLVNSNKELSFGIDNYDGIKWGDILAWLEKQGEQKSDIGISSTTKQKLKESLNKALQKETGESWNKFLDEQKPMTGSKFKVGDKVVHKGTGKTWTVHWYIKEDNVYSVEDSEGLINIYSPDVLEPIEQKPAWSEEDEKLFKLSLENLTELKDRFGKEYGKVGDCIVWLKSLRPQPQWKPNDGQIEAIKDAIEFLGCTKKVREDLKSLYEQLKKLREDRLWS